MASRNPEDEVWGVAYKISKENIDNVAKHLNSRESGYERRTDLFHPCKTVGTIDGDLLNSNITPNMLITKHSSTVILSDTDELPFHVTVYISREDSPLFTGTEDLNTIASHIIECSGPSGPNIEYLYKLAAAMRLIAPSINDEHLYSLEEAVKKLEVKKQYYSS